jgi:hypothetical protein
MSYHQELFVMPLHSKKTVDMGNDEWLTIIRVPTGWMYTFTDYSKDPVIHSSVFVPER